MFSKNMHSFWTGNMIFFIYEGECCSFSQNIHSETGNMIFKVLGGLEVLNLTGNMIFKVLEGKIFHSKTLSLCIFSEGLEAGGCRYGEH